MLEKWLIIDVICLSTPYMSNFVAYISFSYTTKTILQESKKIDY